MHLEALLLQNVQPAEPAGNNATTAAPGAPPASGAPASSPASPFSSLLIFALFIPILFLMFRRNKKEADARAKLKKGDRVVSQSGLVGELVEMDERFAKVKLGPGNTVTMLASSLQPLEAAAATKADDKDLKDLKDAKALAEKK